MDKIVYIIGAGFSAPLGIPVMGNFLIKSKDLYYSNPSRYSHFLDVFQTIEKLSVAKNYYECNLFNIEEILSILEMSEFLNGGKLTDNLNSYIRDVIDAYTPIPNDIERGRAGNWQDWIFGNNDMISEYAYFVSNLLRLRFQKKPSNTMLTGRSSDFIVEKNNNIKSRYSILTLNYDLVFEKISQLICHGYEHTSPIAFEKEIYDKEWNECHLVKLHGCLSGGLIVPPTWAKGNHKEIIPVWKNAFNILCEANHIRFIGYSLPLADSYIKYLLKSAVIEAKHLKSIDVICLDKDGSAKARYDNFFSFENYRFKNASVMNYFEALKLSARRPRSNLVDIVDMEDLENVHFDFMEGNIRRL